ncbi:uncharacterized protein SAPINGB_P004611 [Magnusiomyces paraingens]|uniref:Major facilitator superfamily (MFS) profile domain-containing protein n=1 Tax=Magnusiomyces paraingens TaxID=2606893 RepID=A0A5E8C0W7_9ASCO|nr:uncharacterized protein SAPINGB_P004611 [Saprochaete ingens]VVT55467.1 unnamed protein product [Saprochaete ingens]
MTVKEKFQGFKQKFSNISLPAFIPRLREIDEEVFVQKYSTPLDADGEKIPSDNKVRFTLDREQKEIKYEVRDEANRKWWALFDEFEYKEHRTGENVTEHKWYHWFDVNDSPEERRVIIKIDIVLCFFSFVMYWVKYLDQSNLNNAYVSGMKEDLGMKGNDLVNTQVVYTVGSVVFQLPMMYLIHRYPTHILLPAMDIAWGLFTLAVYRSTSVGMLQALRFFVGVFESAFYPTIHYLYGSWYKPSEYTRRGGIYYFGQMLGLLTSGLVTASCVENLTGVNGLDGWRWMYIVDAIITIPVAIIGFFVLPGVPKKCYSLFLTDEDIFIARERLRKANIALETEGPQFFNIQLWKDLLWDWKYYMFVFLNIWGWNNSNGSSGAYLLWLKSLKEYSIPLVNQYSTITPALGIIWIYMTGALADHARSRWGALIFSQTFNLLGNILLAVWYIPKGAIWFGFCLQYFGWASSAVNYSWASDAMRHNPQHRAITVVSMNMIGQATTAFTSVLVWKTVEAPRFLKGYSFTGTVAFVMMIWGTLILPLYKKEERKYAHEQGILLYNSAKGEVPPEIPPVAPSALSDSDEIEREHFVIDDLSDEKKQ